MKVLVLSPHFAPRFEGGSEIVARAQARALAQRGHEVRVLAGCDTPHTGRDVEEQEVDGLHVSFLPRHAHERYDLLLERPRLVELAARAATEADVVHLHGWATLAGDLAQTLAVTRPVVLTLHDLFVTCPRFFRLPVGGVEACPPRGDVEPCVRCVAPDAPGLALDVLHAGLVERARRWQAELDAAAAVILPSASQRARLASLVTLDPARVHVVPHGLCRAIPRDGAAADWSGAGALRILHLGNLAAAKGVLELADAGARVAAAGHAVELLFAGAAVEEGIEQALRARSGGARVQFLGRFESQGLAARLASFGGCHLAVLPSRAHESYGLVVDEALALGLPTWVSDRGAPRERIGAAGRVVPAEDAGALAHALEAVFAEPGALAREKAAVPADVPDAAGAAARIERLFLDLSR